MFFRVQRGVFVCRIVLCVWGWGGGVTASLVDLFSLSLVRLINGLVAVYPDTYPGVVSPGVSSERVCTSHRTFCSMDTLDVVFVTCYE